MTTPVSRKSHLQTLASVIRDARSSGTVDGAAMNTIAGVMKIDRSKRIESDEIQVMITGLEGAKLSPQARRMYLHIITGAQNPPDGPIDGPIALYAVTIRDWTRRVQAGEVTREHAMAVHSATKEIMRPFGGATAPRGRARAAATPLAAHVATALEALPDHQQVGAIQAAFAEFDAAIQLAFQ